MITGSLRHPVLKIQEIELLYTTYICIEPVPRTCLEMIPVDNGKQDITMSLASTVKNGKTLTTKSNLYNGRG